MICAARRSVRAPPMAPWPPEFGGICTTREGVETLKRATASGAMNGWYERRHPPGRLNACPAGDEHRGAVALRVGDTCCASGFVQEGLSSRTGRPPNRRERLRHDLGRSPFPEDADKGSRDCGTAARKCDVAPSLQRGSRCSVRSARLRSRSSARPGRNGQRLGERRRERTRRSSHAGQLIPTARTTYRRAKSVTGCRRSIDGHFMPPSGTH